MRASRAAATVALSRIDHHTSVADPGSSVASTIVLPLALIRRVIDPADSRRWISQLLGPGAGEWWTSPGKRRPFVDAW